MLASRISRIGRRILAFAPQSLSYSLHSRTSGGSVDTITVGGGGSTPKYLSIHGMNLIESKENAWVHGERCEAEREMGQMISAELAERLE